jgi:hypothetical protein
MRCVKVEQQISDIRFHQCSVLESPNLAFKNEESRSNK